MTTSLRPGAPRASGRRPPTDVGVLPLPWLLRRVNQRYRVEIRAHLRRAGLSDLPQPGFWALMALARGTRDASRLVSEMGVSKQAVSKLVDNLVVGGFVERKPSGVDRRKSDLLLTPKGTKAVAIMATALGATERAFADELGAARLAELHGMLERLARHDQEDI
jgi:DNA-binding MarR family transcriptional regulator